MEKKTLILVGSGHVHLHLIKNLDHIDLERTNIFVISPSVFYYSGLGPGILGGFFPPEKDIVDTQKLTQKKGGKFIKSKIKSIDAPVNEVILEDNSRISYDLLSLNLGSEIDTNHLNNSKKFGIPVKPIKNLLKLRKDLELYFKSPNKTNENKNLSIIIIGAGAAGVEVAGNLDRLAKRFNSKLDISLIEITPRILNNFPKKASKLVENNFKKRNISILTNTSILRIEKDYISLKNNQKRHYDILLYSTGVIPSSVIKESHLNTDKEGAMIVNNYLQSLECPNIFGGGDCINLNTHDLSKVGVYAIREAPILLNNLKLKLADGDLLKFRPQSKYLLILNIGDGNGIFIRGNFVCKSKIALKFKNWLDLCFLKKYQ